MKQKSQSCQIVTHQVLVFESQGCSRKTLFPTWWGSAPLPTYLETWTLPGEANRPAPGNCHCQIGFLSTNSKLFWARPQVMAYSVWAGMAKWIRWLGAVTSLRYGIPAGRRRRWLSAGPTSTDVGPALRQRLAAGRIWWCLAWDNWDKYLATVVKLDYTVVHLPGIV